jgi:predicted O-linked N-acetylglucosamine transferase (SPINDLY family)
MLGRLLKSLRTAGAPASAGGGAAERNEAGLAAWQRGDLAAAEREFRGALAADPGFAPAYGNLGMVVWDQRRLDEGLALLRRGVEIDPAHAGVRINLANALVIGNQHAQAIDHYAEVLRRRPGHPQATANLLKPLLDTCRWDEAERLVGGLVERWRAAPADDAVLDAITPFNTLLVELPQAMRLAVARRYADRVAARAASLRQVEHAPRTSGGRLRIGYASADFHDHATLHLMAGLFEAHDRERFEIHAYSWGIDDGSAYRARAHAAIEHFHDVRDLGHDAVAQRIADDGIDILVDLKGYTGESRPEIFALRPAPVQVNYLGYPGTMGAAFMDWMIADSVLVPPGAEAGYTEQVMRLTGSYQANDRLQRIAERASTRAQWRLPEDAFVFACFNKHHKIERPTFAAWMRILAAAPRAVLWLLGGHGEQALARAAQATGIDPRRIVFADKAPKPEHLERHRVADLFLDTRTYNAHTTASDALWGGLPVLTWPTDAFAGRVASSLLHAIGLPELVMPDGASYERTAIELARDPSRLAELRAKVAANRLATALFDTHGLARNLEDAYQAIGRTDAARSGAA